MHTIDNIAESRISYRQLLLQIYLIINVSVNSLLAHTLTRVKLKVWYAERRIAPFVLATMDESTSCFCGEAMTEPAANNPEDYAASRYVTDPCSVPYRLYRLDTGERGG